MEENTQRSPVEESGMLLDVQHLVTRFFTDEGIVTAVDDVSFHLNKGEVLGIVGESGSGKSQTCMSVMQLIPVPPGEITSGKVLYKGKDLLAGTEREMQKIRGKEISMVFQEPMTALNPVYTVGTQIAEGIRKHDKTVSKAEARARSIELLHAVGIPAPEKRIDDYPHQLSGGMRQRVVIAIALAANPSILIADEPTTALDVTIQAQILELLVNVTKGQGRSMILITHDLGVIAQTCDRVLVMYGGEIVEEAPVKELYRKPLHPYTMGLMRSIPRMDREEKRLYSIKGMTPNPYNMPVGCRFCERCEYAQGKCVQCKPVLQELEKGRYVACHFAREIMIHEQ